MQKTLFSRHIPKDKMRSEDAKNVSADLVLFNRMKQASVRLQLRGSKPEIPEGVDLRKKANKELKEKLAPSFHMQLKNRFGTNTYFINSATQEAAASIKSVKELRSDYISEQEEKLDQVKDKLKQTAKQREELEKVKAKLIERSKARKVQKKTLPKPRLLKGGQITFDKESGVYTIWHTNLRTMKRTVISTYKDDYCFETQYVVPTLKKLNATISGLEGRIAHIEAKIRHLKEDVPSICFGSKDFFRKQNTVYADKHDVWQHAFRKRRCRGMTISGRKDSKDGNFVFWYNIATHDLHYRAMNGSDIVFPNVVFPYGQKLLETYIRNQTDEQLSPIAWRIEETGGSFLIKCIITLSDVDMNTDCSDGCIAFDTNVDHLAVAELDRYGNLLDKTTIPFKLDGLTSEQAEHVLSHVLDQVFQKCVATHKPLAAEDLKDVATSELYGSAKRNRILSGFAHTKIRELTDSKSYKYHVAVKYVNPAFTSQIGKIRYMRLYGLSVHTAAAFVIGRRAMGFKEPVPAAYRISIPAEKLNKHHWGHWGSIYRITKNIKPHEMFAPVQNGASSISQAGA